MAGSAERCRGCVRRRQSDPRSKQYLYAPGSDAQFVFGNVRGSCGGTDGSRGNSNPSATTAPSAPGPDSIAEVQEQGYNWGRVRAYFSLGRSFRETQSRRRQALQQHRVRPHRRRPVRTSHPQMLLRHSTWISTGLRRRLSGGLLCEQAGETGDAGRCCSAV